MGDGGVLYVGDVREWFVMIEGGDRRRGGRW